MAQVVKDGSAGGQRYTADFVKKPETFAKVCFRKFDCIYSQKAVVLGVCLFPCIF